MKFKFFKRLTNMHILYILAGVIITIIVISSFLPRLRQVTNAKEQFDTQIKSNCSDILIELLQRRPGMTVDRAKSMIKETICEVQPKDLIPLIEGVLGAILPSELKKEIKGLDQCSIFNGLKAQKYTTALNTQESLNSCVLTSDMFSKLQRLHPKHVTKTPQECKINDITMKTIGTTAAEYQGCIFNVAEELGDIKMTDSELYQQLDKIKMKIFTIYALMNMEYIFQIVDDIIANNESVKNLVANTDILKAKLAENQKRRAEAQAAQLQLQGTLNEEKKLNTQLSTSVNDLQVSSNNLESAKYKINVAPIIPKP